MTIHKIELPLSDGKILSVETGRMAKEAGGAVVLTLGDTVVLATATGSQAPREGINFFPLLVDFEEKMYSVGKIPGGFFRREGKSSEKATLNARKIDRPIRPLFPDGFFNDVQIVVNPFSYDQENSPDILGIIGASAALSISPVPFQGPIGAARVGKIDGQFVVNPTVTQMKDSSLDVVIAGTKDKILMIEAGSSEVSEDDMYRAIEAGQGFIKEVIDLQLKLVALAGKPKMAFSEVSLDKTIHDFINDKYRRAIGEAAALTDKAEQYNKIAQIEESIKKDVSGNEALSSALLANPKAIKKGIEDIEYECVRDVVLNEGKRIDGRGLKEMREIKCEVGVLPRAHGSALFSRGQTQVLTIATLASLGEEQIIDGVDLEETGKRYMHHYNFPAFSVGEVRPSRGPGRREIGHGALAEKALVPVVPDRDKFPYTIRLVSEVLGSNGSTSMASTCGSTLALMDAGVKISAPVAGISVGLITKGDKWVTITDIQGIEDHHGDMDFKVTGTRNGITAIQVDIKIKGLTLEMVKAALLQAKEGRLFILDKMEAAISSPRGEMSPYAPRVISFTINPEKIGLVIGPGGKNIKNIIATTGAQVDIDNSGTVMITTADVNGAAQAKKMIDEIAFEPKVGDIFKAKVVRVTTFGVFAEIPGGKDGLVHKSSLSNERFNKIEDIANVGTELYVKVTEIDDMGRINLTAKDISEEDKKRAI